MSTKKLSTQLPRRQFIKSAGAGLFVTSLHALLPVPGWPQTAFMGLTKTSKNFRYDLTIKHNNLYRRAPS